MAGISYDGLDDLLKDLDSIVDIPDEVLDDMLDAAADVVVRAQKEEIASQGLIDTGELQRSISRGRKYSKDFGRKMDIYPQGTRKNGKKEIKNAEVGFIHEFGAPREKIPAKNWMKKANERCADQAVESAAKVYERYLEKHNL